MNDFSFSSKYNDTFVTDENFGTTKKVFPIERCPPERGLSYNELPKEVSALHKCSFKVMLTKGLFHCI